MHSVMAWGAFLVCILAMLAVDLGVAHRRSHVISIREALVWSGVWIALALLFCWGVYVWRGAESAMQFLAGYLIERSLSMDNIFVFLLIFSYFQVPAQHQHDVLFWGILGALILRALFIASGVALMHRFHWVIYLFGIFLVLTGIKLAFDKDKQVQPEKNPILRLFRRTMGATTTYHGKRFFIRDAGRWLATPLLVTLIVVETTDLVFAVDSIPAVLAVSSDPFIVYTSNVFAILGLRALYFAVAGMLRLFHHLHYGLSVILVFVGVKMLIADYYPMPIGVALAVVAALLALSVVASLLWPDRNATAPPRLSD